MAEPFLWGSAFSPPSVIGLPRMTPLSNGTFLILGKTGRYPDFTLTAWIYNADGSLKARQDLDVPDHEVPGVYGDLEIPAIDPMAAELPDGRIAITWTVNTPSSGNTYVAPWMCIYSADLAPTGAPKPVFDPVSGARDYAESIIALDDGTLVVSARNEKDGHAYLRVFSPDGTRSAALDLGLAGGSAPGVALTDVTALANGNVAVVVREGTSSLKGYVLTPSDVGNPASPPYFEISTSTSIQKEAVKVTALRGGGFVVTWMEQGSAEEPAFNAFFRVYRPDGTASDVKPVSPLALPDLLSAGHSDVLSLPSGGFAVAYEKATELVGGVPGFEVHLAIFDEHGARVSDDLRVSQKATTASIYLHELHPMADGRILVRHSQGIQIVDPRGEAVSLKGTARDDHYIGTAFNDTLDGGAGSDVLNGAGGIDFVSFASSSIGVTASLSGASGDGVGDTWISIEGIIGSSFGDVFTGNGSSILKGRSGDDTYRIKAGDILEESAHEGRDTVLVGGSYKLRADAEVEVLRLFGISSKTRANLTGSETANEIVGHGGKNTLRGLSGNDVLKALSGNDTLKGDAGADKLHGGSGKDKLYGGTGRDVFVFDTKPSKSTNVDRIYDFNPKYDSIQLENKIFTKLGKGSTKGSTKGVKFKKDMFVKGDAAKDKEDRIIYDNKTGALSYDQDGTGSKAQVKIATLSKNLKLSYHDFFVI
ncbi:calcium-binding protein [Microvirga splendida]|uniref:Calcium-binding protein n=1 Tax=Microvirga splendida TaxID=2795727 RepID=A0ABS0XWK0_9HYPH|nr:calcium-binding protein [Microvirga splendida]MBJ6124416.1 calcium-binding protein [Microvirga splendida]